MSSPDEEMRSLERRAAAGDHEARLAYADILESTGRLAVLEAKAASGDWADREELRRALELGDVFRTLRQSGRASRARYGALLWSSGEFERLEREARAGRSRAAFRNALRALSMAVPSRTGGVVVTSLLKAREQRYVDEAHDDWLSFVDQVIFADVLWVTTYDGRLVRQELPNLVEVRVLDLPDAYHPDDPGVSVVHDHQDRPMPATVTRGSRTSRGDPDVLEPLWPVELLSGHGQFPVLDNAVELHVEGPKIDISGRVDWPSWVSARERAQTPEGNAWRDHRLHRGRILWATMVIGTAMTGAAAGHPAQVKLERPVRVRLLPARPGTLDTQVPDEVWWYVEFIGPDAGSGTLRGRVVPSAWGDAWSMDGEEVEVATDAALHVAGTRYSSFPASATDWWTLESRP